MRLSLRVLVEGFDRYWLLAVLGNGHLRYCGIRIFPKTAVFGKKVPEPPSVVVKKTNKKSKPTNAPLSISLAFKVSKCFEMSSTALKGL